MVVFALFTSSRHVIVGPDAAIALLVGAAIGPLAAGDAGKAVTLATVLAFLTAGVLLLMARLRLGIAADFLSSPAMLGFMNGAAVVIVGSQIGKFCGIRLEEDNTLLRLWEWATRLDETHARTLLIGLACIAVLALCRWKVRQVPGAVAVFVLAMIAGRLVDFSALGVPVIGTVDLHLPDAVRPGLHLTDATPLFTAAIGIALLVFSEGVVLGRSVASQARLRDQSRPRIDRVWRGQCRGGIVVQLRGRLQPDPHAAQRRHRRADADGQLPRRRAGGGVRLPARAVDRDDSLGGHRGHPRFHRRDAG